MGQITWYKRYPEDALAGMMGLTLEERGAYNTVLDLIYTRDGKLPDDDRFIAGWLGCDVRVWKRIKARLIEAGKLFSNGGFLRNSRADEEVLTALSRVGSARDAGKASARSRASKSNQKPNEINDDAPTDVATGASTAVSTNQSLELRKKEYGRASALSCPEDVEEQVWRDFLAMRKAKRAPLTETAMAKIGSQAVVAGWTLNDALAECVTRGWQGFKAEWVAPRKAETNGRRGSDDGSEYIDLVLREIQEREAHKAKEIQ